MRKWDIARCTLSYLLAVLDQSDPADPHSGQIEIRSLSELDGLIEGME